jgi:hypothetical protein
VRGFFFAVAFVIRDYKTAVATLVCERPAGEAFVSDVRGVCVCVFAGVSLDP